MTALLSPALSWLLMLALFAVAIGWVVVRERRADRAQYRAEMDAHIDRYMPREHAHALWLANREDLRQ